MVLERELSKEEISKEKLQQAEKVLEGKKMELWKESVSPAVTQGIPKDNMEEYANSLIAKMALKDEEQKTVIRETLKVMAYASKHDCPMLEVNYRYDEWNSLYGFISAVRDNGGDTVTVASAFHKLNFKEAKRQGWQRLIFGESSKLAINEIEGIMNTFCKHKFLKMLMERNMIANIKYIK